MEFLFYAMLLFVVGMTPRLIAALVGISTVNGIYVLVWAISVTIAVYAAQHGGW